MHSVVQLLTPVKTATKQLSLEYSILPDVLPTISHVLDEITTMEVPEPVHEFRNLLVSCLSDRLGMLLDTKIRLPALTGHIISIIILTEIAIASYVSPRYCIAIKPDYGHMDKSVVAELRRLHNLHGLSDGDENEYETPEDIESRNDCGGSSMQLWIGRASKHQGGRVRRGNTQIHALEYQFIQYLSDIVGRAYNDEESRLFWVRARQQNKYHKLHKLAGLFFIIPSSSTAQERHFS